MSRFAFPALLLALVFVCSGCMMPNHDAQISANEAYLKQEGITALPLLSTAPQLTGVTDSTGQPVSLSALLDRHKTGVLLFFFPALDTPNSSANLLDWDKRQAALTAEGLGAYAICLADAAAAAKYSQELGITLPLLADPQGTAAAAYGCLPSGGQFPQRTTIGLSPQGGVVYYHRGTLDQPAVTAVEKAYGITPVKK